MIALFPRDLTYDVGTVRISCGHSNGGAHRVKRSLDQCADHAVGGDGPNVGRGLRARRLALGRNGDGRGFLGGTP